MIRTVLLRNSGSVIGGVSSRNLGHGSGSRCNVARLLSSKSGRGNDWGDVNRRNGNKSGKSNENKTGKSTENKMNFRPNRQSSSPDYGTAFVPKSTKKEKKPRRKKGNPNPIPLGQNVPRIPGIPRDEAEELDIPFGPLAAETIRAIRRRHEHMTFFRGAMEDHDDSDNYQSHGADDEAEEDLRMLDYFMAEPGSTEDLVGERRALSMEMTTEEERERFLDNMERIIQKQKLVDLGIGKDNYSDDEKDEDEGDETIPNDRRMSDEEYQEKVDKLFSNKREYDEDSEDEDEFEPGERDENVTFDPRSLVHGEWAEMLIRVDRNVRLWRGGRIESYRALVIGGNMNGCGGFAIGKAPDPLEAIDVASRKCKRNIFFVDRYQNEGLTRDLVGKQNSCKLVIMASSRMLRGNPLVREILKRFGIVKAKAKAHGNRSPYNVVRATFKALMTHTSIEDISLGRGKRIVSVDRAHRLQV